MQVRTRVKGLTCFAKESESLLDLEKREQTQSSYVGGQADKTWQLMDMRRRKRGKNRKIKNSFHSSKLGQLSKQ